MTRAEVNAIKARMLDEIMDVTDDGKEFDAGVLMGILDNQAYTLNFLSEIMEEQAEMAKQAGY